MIIWQQYDDNNVNYNNAAADNDYTNMNNDNDYTGIYNDKDFYNTDTQM